MRQLRVVSDPTGAIAAPCLADYVDHRVLGAGVAETQAIPTGARIVAVTSTTLAYLRPNADPAVPAADVTDGTGGHVLQAGITRWFSIDGVTDLRVIAAGTPTVSFEFYS
jgi:hypothetical protein